MEAQLAEAVQIAQTLAYGNSSSATQTTLAITDGNALTLTATGSLSFNQTGTNTLELIGSAVGGSGTDSQTIAYGNSSSATQTTLAITDGNALTLTATGSLSFNQTSTNTLELVGAGIDTSNANFDNLTASTTLTALGDSNLATTTITGPLTTSGAVTNNGNLTNNGAVTNNATTTLKGALVDSNGNVGTAGQHLSSTGTATAWVTPTSGTDSQTIAYGNSATTTQTTLVITDGNALTLTATGSLSFNQTSTNTLELVGAGIDTSNASFDNLTVSTTLTALGDSNLASTTITGPLTTSSSVTNNGPVTNNATTTLGGALVDASGDVGTAGQVLSSTGTSTNWVDSFAPISGTATNSTLHWNGTAWVENTGLQSDGTSTTSLTTELIVANNATVTGTLEVTGNTTLTADLYVGANSTASGTLTANSTTTLKAALVDGAASSGTAGRVLTSTGTSTLWAVNTTLTDTDTDTKIQVEKGGDDDTIRFDTAGTERVVISNTGDVGIGNTSPTYTLDVYGSYRVQTLANNTAVASRTNGGDGFQGPPDYTIIDAIIYTSFTTGADITTTQTIFETGGNTTGTDFLITGGNFRVYAGNTSTIYISTPVLANTAYSAAVVYDLTANELRLYLTQTANAVLQASDLVATAVFSEGSWAGGDPTGVGALNTGNRAGISGNFLGTGLSQIDLYTTNDITAISSDKIRLVVDTAGNVGVGTASPTHTLTVSGTFSVTGAATFGSSISQTGTGVLHPDYVFEEYFEGGSEYNPSYRFTDLEEIESFLAANKHLPGVQSRAEIAKSGNWNLSENVRTNLEKIEELFLYTIEQEKELKAILESKALLEEENNALKASLATILKRLEKLENK